jgi:hypothetical protein
MFNDPYQEQSTFELFTSAKPCSKALISGGLANTQRRRLLKATHRSLYHLIDRKRTFPHANFENGLYKSSTRNFMSKKKVVLFPRGDDGEFKNGPPLSTEDQVSGSVIPPRKLKEWLEWLFGSALTFFHHTTTLVCGTEGWLKEERPIKGDRSSKLDFQGLSGHARNDCTAWQTSHSLCVPFSEES